MAKQNEVSVIIRAKDLASTVVGKIQNTLKGVTRVARRVARGMLRLGAAGAGIATSFGLLAKRGQEFLNVQRGFSRVVDGNGVQALQRMQKASKGLLSQYELMVNFNRAVTLGAVQNAEEYERLIETTVGLSRAQGLAVDQGLEKFTLALSRQSQKLLDDLGIRLSASEANREYAAQLNKTVDQLTEAEKAQAFRTIALQRAEAALEDLGESEATAGDAVVRATVAFRDFRDQLSTTVAESPTVNEFFTTIADLGTMIVEALNGDRATVMAALGSTGRLFGISLATGISQGIASTLDVKDLAGTGIFRGPGLALLSGPQALSNFFEGRAEEGRAGIETELDILASLSQQGQAEAAMRNEMQRRGREAAARAAGLGTPEGDQETGETVGEAAGRTMAETFADRLAADPILAKIAGQGRAFRRRQAAQRVDAAFQFQGGGGLAPVTGLNQRIAGGGDGGLRLGDRSRAAEAAAAAREASDVLSDAGDIAADTFFRTARAAVHGTSQIEAAFTSMLSRILQHDSLLGGGLLGTVVGGVIGVAGALLSRNNRPTPVRVEDFSSQAERKMQQRDKAPFNFELHIGGRVIRDPAMLRAIGADLRALEENDAIERISHRSS